MNARFVTALAIVMLIGPTTTWAAEAVPISLTVKLRDKVADKVGKPFKDVGGFIFRRNNKDYEGATCPDVSNNKGEVTCRLQCNKNDGTLRLQLVAPNKERAPIVAGLTATATPAVTVEACKVTSTMPIDVVFRKADVLMAELFANNPSLKSAFDRTGGGAADSRPFFQDLSTLAKDPKNRQDLLELSRLAESLAAAPPDQQLPNWPRLEYSAVSTGVNSALLQAIVEESSGSKLSAEVVVSGNQAEFFKSLSNVQRELATKPTLSKSELAISNAVREIRSKPDSAVLKLDSLATSKRGF